MFAHFFTFLTIIFLINIKKDFLSPLPTHNYRSAAGFTLLAPIISSTAEYPRSSNILVSTPNDKVSRFYSKYMPLLKSKRMFKSSSRLFTNFEDLLRNYYIELQKNTYTRRLKMLLPSNFVFNQSLKYARKNQTILHYLLKKYTIQTKNYFKKTHYKKLFWKAEIFSFFLARKINFLVSRISPKRIKLRSKQSFRVNRLSRNFIWRFYNNFYKEKADEVFALLISLFEKKRKNKKRRSYSFSFSYFKNSLAKFVRKQLFIDSLKFYFFHLEMNDSSTNVSNITSKSWSKMKKNFSTLSKSFPNINFGRISSKSINFLWGENLNNFNLILSLKIISFFLRKERFMSLIFTSDCLKKNKNDISKKWVPAALTNSPPVFRLMQPQQSYLAFFKLVKKNIIFQEKRKDFLICRLLNNNKKHLRRRNNYNNNKSTFLTLRQKRLRKRFRRKLFFSKIKARNNLLELTKKEAAKSKFYYKSQISSIQNKSGFRRHFSTIRQFHLCSHHRQSIRWKDKKKIKELKTVFSNYLKSDPFDIYNSSVLNYIYSNFYTGPYFKNANKNQKSTDHLLKARSFSDFVKNYNRRLLFIKKQNLKKKHKQLIDNYISGQRLFSFPKTFSNSIACWKRWNKIVDKRKFISLFDDYSYKLKFLGCRHNRNYYKKVFSINVLKKKNHFSNKRIFFKNNLLYYNRMIQRLRKRNKKFLLASNLKKMHQMLNPFRLRFFYKDFFRKLNIKKFKDIFTYLRYGYFFVRHPKALHEIRRRLKWFLKKNFEKKTEKSATKQLTTRFFSAKIRKNQQILIMRYNSLGLKHKYVPRNFSDPSSLFSHNFSAFQKITRFFRKRNILRSSLKISDFLNNKLSIKASVLDSADFFIPKYYLFFKKKKNNFYITITDHKGGVIFFQSCGYYLIKSLQKRNKKLRSAFFNLKFMLIPIILNLKKKKINRIHTFFQNQHLPKWWLRRFCRSFINGGIFISHIKFVPSISHGSKDKKKKARRL